MDDTEGPRRINFEAEDVGIPKQRNMIEELWV